MHTGCGSAACSATAFAVGRLSRARVHSLLYLAGTVFMLVLEVAWQSLLMQMMPQSNTHDAYASSEEFMFVSAPCFFTFLYCPTVTVVILLRHMV